MVFHHNILFMAAQISDKQIAYIMRLLGRDLWRNNLDLEVPLRENIDSGTASVVINWLREGDTDSAKKQLIHLGVPETSL